MKNVPYEFPQLISVSEDYIFENEKKQEIRGKGSQLTRTL